MTYVLLLLLYRAWLIGGVLLILCCTSSATFSRGRPARVRAAILALPLAFVWPLALLSKEGRRVLKKVLPNQW